MRVKREGLERDVLGRLPGLRKCIRIIYDWDENDLKFQVDIPLYREATSFLFQESVMEEQNRIEELEKDAGHKLSYLRDNLTMKISRSKPGGMGDYNAVKRSADGTIIRGSEEVADHNIWYWADKLRALQDGEEGCFEAEACDKVLCSFPFKWAAIARNLLGITLLLRLDTRGTVLVEKGRRSLLTFVEEERRLLMSCTGLHWPLVTQIVRIRRLASLMLSLFSRRRKLRNRWVIVSK